MNERMQTAWSEDTLEIATPAAVTAIRGDRRRSAVVPQDVFLSTAAPRHWDWRLAMAVVLVSIVGLTLAALYPTHRSPPPPSLIPPLHALLFSTHLLPPLL